MVLGSDWDWYSRDKDRLDREENFLKYAREHPNASSVKQAMGYRALHPEYEQEMEQLRQKVEHDEREKLNRK